MPLRASWASAVLNIGDTQVTTLSDGHLTLPQSFMFGDMPQAELATVLAEHGITEGPLMPECNVTLVRDGERVILFDAGAGDGFQPSVGQLAGALDTIGVSVDDVTHVVFTHAHPDHLWGVLDDFDDPMFPNAEHMIGRTEWDYWIRPETVDEIGEERATFAVGAQRRLSALEDAITRFDAEQEILPGIWAHAAHGHTPGHMAFEVRSGSESVMVVGDAIGNPHVAFARPEWPSGSDQDQALGAQTRGRLLDALAQDQMQLIGFHLPNGGIGRVERAAEGYRFVTA
jgi:glyoxylase-like metal-dependent hydrolase (beta-lactamase superfamily II)